MDRRKPLRTSTPLRLAVCGAAGAIALAACSSSSQSGGSIAGASCASGTIKASGSSAQKNAISEWAAKYQDACADATIEYQANGSGAGIQDFINAQTAFAGSDSAIKGTDKEQADKRCASGQAINIPMVGGAVVAAYNVDGISKLQLTPQLLAKIFNSKITRWNDPAIAAANPGVSLPDTRIAQFHRSDSSGTTDNFTQYLVANAPGDWPATPGKDWTAAGGQGAKGNDGVASSVKSTPNSIGYVELSFARVQKLQTAVLNNGGGPVAATAQTASTAIGLATVTGTQPNLPLQLDYTTKDPSAYPLVLLTYEIICDQGLAAGQLSLAKAFLAYTSSAEGQGVLAPIGYVPLPEDLLTKVRSAVGSLK